MNPLVSVVLPTYNEENTVDRAIQSILDQTYENIELIIVDDQSTDETQDVVNSFDDDRVTLCVRENGKNGLSGALNYGIKESNGKYIARQDADDKSDKKRLEKQVKLAERNDLDIVGTGSFNVDTSGNTISERQVPEDPNPNQFNAGSQFIHGSLLMKKEMLENINGYNTEYDTSEDVELLARAVRSGYTFKNINEPLYYFTVDENSKYRSDVRRATLYATHAVKSENLDIKPSEFANLSDSELSQYLNEQELNMFYREIAQEHLRFGRNKKARQYARKNPRSFALIAILILSFSPNFIIRMVISIYRSLINLKY